MAFCAMRIKDKLGITERESVEQVKKVKKDFEVENRGKLLIAVTCIPADISYPTDLRLLNVAREKANAGCGVRNENTGGHG